MKRNEILGEHKKGTKAVKYNKKPTDHSAEYGKAKEKLAPVKPMEGYNPNSVGAEHRRKLDQSHAADLKARAEGPDATERDHQRYQNYLDKKEQMANDYNDRMERESVAQEGHRDSRDSYQRDYDFSQSGFGDQGKREFKRREMEHELGHETNNYAVAIDGRTWKVFASKNHAQAVARSLQNKGKKATVHETGAEPTAEAMGADMGKITKVDPATKKATLTKPDGTSMEVDSTALKPTPDGKMSIDTPDTDELKAGTPVVSTEDMTAPTTDSESPINGDEENADLRRLRELAGQEELGERVTPIASHPEYKEAESSFGMAQGIMKAVKMMNPTFGPWGGKLTAVNAAGETVGVWDKGAWNGKNSQLMHDAQQAADASPEAQADRDAANAPFVPKDYQTKEPLTKGPDGKWRNSKGEERDSLHGGPISAGGGAMFRSLTPRTPTPESADNVLLQKMLSIAGLR